MTGFDIELQGMDPEYLISTKTLHHNGKTLNTPFASQVADQWTQREMPLEEARGFNEFFRRISPDDLPNKEDRIIRDIDNTETFEREFSNLFISFEGEENIRKDTLYLMAKIQNQTSDFLCAPLLPDIVDAVNSDEREIDEEEYVKRHIEIFNRFIEVVDEHGFDKEVMGVVPVFEWKYNQKVIQNLIEKEIRAICINFNGRSPLVKAQIRNVITPLLANYSSNDRLMDAFIYAINAHRGTKNVANDFISISMGIDAIGGYHTPLSGDKEFFDKLDDMEKDTFRMFKSNSLRYIEPKIERLDEYFPANSNLDSARIKSLAQNGRAASARKVLRAEQMGLAANSLRQQVTQKEAGKNIESKLEKEGDVLTVLENVRSMYDRGQRQSNLDEFGLI